MINIQIGELYLVRQFYWLMFPAKELSKISSAFSDRGDAKNRAVNVSKSCNCNVTILDQGNYFVLLEADDNFYKILDCNGNIGWFCTINFSKCFEIMKEQSNGNW